MRRSLIALFGMALLTACTNVNSLKNAFQPHGVLIGAALNVNEVKGNVPEATELITSQFNSIVAENCMKQEVTAPEEGKFDFTVVDNLVADARSHNLKLALLWFGSWKNGITSYTPTWVKKDTGRFPLAQTPKGKPLPILTTLGSETCQADAKAFPEIDGA